MLKKRSKYGVFIIESLRGDEFCDGDNLRQILDLSEIINTYKKAETREDFVTAIQEFKESKLRYLHLSCHADTYGIEVNGDNITNTELSDIFKNNVSKKRIFLSACKGGNKKFATAAIIKCGCQSIIGTPIDLYFDKAALFWPSFYHVINSIDQNKMNKATISETLKRCVDLFEIPINYYHSINGSKRYLRRYKFRPNMRTTNFKISASKYL